MFLRFQKERVKKARNSSLFNLDGGDEEFVLTHKGEVLGENNVGDDDWRSDDDDDQAGLGRDVVNNLHFGGGLIASQRNNNYDNSDDAAPVGGAPKSRLDALQEIVMKSKLHKMQKKEAKEEQENDREKLDKEFQSLVSNSVLEFRPTKRDRSEDNNGAELDDYDAMLRTMAFETKVQPSDRTKSAEEVAVETRTRLEELEAARLRRMKAATTDLDDEALLEEAFSGGVRQVGDSGLSKKKRRMVTDDEVDGSFGSNYMPEERKSKSKKRLPNVDDDDEDDIVEDDDVDSEGSDEDGSEGSGDEEDDDDDEWEDDEDGDDAVESTPKESKSTMIQERKKMNSDEEEDSDEELGEDDDDDDDGDRGKKKVSGEVPILSERAAKRIKKADKAIESLVSKGINDSMPHKLPCPANLEDFDSLVDRYVLSDGDLQQLITRILSWNSVHLPGTEGTENKNRMHNFMDVLLKVFVRLADSLPSSQIEICSVNNQVCHENISPLSIIVFRS